MKKKLSLLFFIILKFIIQYFAIHPVYELHRDEFLHLDQGLHLDWGYLSLPPVTSWISAIIFLLGNGEFWVKFFPALFGALTLYVTWKIIESLGGNLFACVLGALAIIFSVFARINTLFQPNSLDFLLWTTSYYFIIKYILSKENKWLYFLALSLGFGFLNKYNIVFLLLGLIPAFIITPQRKIFTNKHLYFAITLALLIISPNLIWQYTHSFPVLYHLDQLSRIQLVNVSTGDFIMTQFLFFFSALFIIIAGLTALIIFPLFSKLRVILWSFIFTMGLFIFFNAKSYYSIGLYPVLIAVGSVYLEKITLTKWKFYLRPAMVIVVVVLALPVLNYALPIYSPEAIIKNSEKYKELGLLRWEDGENHHIPQDFADMLGWKEMANKTQVAYNEINDPEHTLILCDNYGQAGAINYYAKDTRSQAVTFHADYVYWFPLENEIRHVILVKTEGDEDPERKREREFFDEVYLSGELKNEMAREYETKIWVLKNASVDVNEILKEEIKEEIDERKQ
ncbi:glycosyltransferase family 39 protein [Mangrovivirga sp. M17]|uniref:Glycosyltransferase family 39 protein n=1 Tax=Mangrovivirga halotolerans TaxID=2993936 RepID=A0ABT3RWP1_9BACT|nr:glycosyltransferase family 39 protein [Mangrovivirga halotolerans]MCX2745570.1 glycosyltransferase family 39 protein [Mangrovivirga halotolerans]